MSEWPFVAFCGHSEMEMPSLSPKQTYLPLLVGLGGEAFPDVVGAVAIAVAGSHPVLCFVNPEG